MNQSTPFRLGPFLGRIAASTAVCLAFAGSALAGGGFTSPPGCKDDPQDLTETPTTAAIEAYRGVAGEVVDGGFTGVEVDGPPSIIVRQLDACEKICQSAFPACRAAGAAQIKCTKRVLRYELAALSRQAKEEEDDDLLEEIEAIKDAIRDVLRAESDSVQAACEQELDVCPGNCGITLPQPPSS